MPPDAEDIFREHARQDVIRCWKKRLDRSQWGRRVVEAVLERWLDRSYGRLTFHLTQILSGHGMFAFYLFRTGKTGSLVCEHCGGTIDKAEHTLAECPSWDVERTAFRTIVGEDLFHPAVVGQMLQDREKWRWQILPCPSVKEDVERARQGQPARDARRRRRRDDSPSSSKEK